MRLKVAVAIPLLGMFGVFAFLGLAQWQKHHLLSAALKHYQRGDLRSAFLSARAAIDKDPGNLQAHLLLVQLTKASNSPEVIFWQQKLVNLAPGNASYLINLAVSATNLGEWFIAERSLEQVPSKDQDSVSYHEAAVRLALATRQYDLARKHLLQALKIHPDNRFYELNLATIDLLSSDPQTAAAAREKLIRIREGSTPDILQAANRALLMGARLRKDSAQALSFASQLGREKGSPLPDQLLYLEELQETNPTEFERELDSRIALSKAMPEQIYLIMTWMNTRGLAAQTIALRSKLSPQVWAHFPVPLAIAEAYGILQDWGALSNLVLNADWGNFNFLRFAIQARAVESNSPSNRSAQFRLKWERAIVETYGDPNAMAMLARMVDGWGWKKECAEVYWYIARRKTGQHLALQALYRIYLDARDTKELCKVAQRILELEPENPIAKNNLAMLSLLLGKDLPQAHQLAKEDSRSLPNEPAIASTLALSMRLQKNPKEAQSLLEKLPEQALKTPSIAACYGAILADNGELKKSAVYLGIAEEHRTSLFPEELAMVEDARNSIK